MPRAFGNAFGNAFGGPLNVGTLVLKVGTDGPDPAYQDGDILHAFNRRHVRHEAADRLCHPRIALRQSNGLIASDHIARYYLEATRQYRIERVSATAVVRTDLWTSEVEVIGTTPNAQGEAMDVPLFVARRRLAQGFGLFGTDGAEVWYGGGYRVDDAAMNVAWAAIEQHSSHREVDHALWPLQSSDLRHFLAIHVDDFDDVEAVSLVAEVMDESNPELPVMLRKRARQILWRELHGMSAQRIAQVEDRNISLDVRAERKHVRAVHVRVRNG